MLGFPDPGLCQTELVVVGQGFYSGRFSFPPPLVGTEQDGSRRGCDNVLRANTATQTCNSSVSDVLSQLGLCPTEHADDKGRSETGTNKWTENSQYRLYHGIPQQHEQKSQLLALSLFPSGWNLSPSRQDRVRTFKTTMCFFLFSFFPPVFFFFVR